MMPWARRDTIAVLFAVLCGVLCWTISNLATSQSGPQGTVVVELAGSLTGRIRLDRRTRRGERTSITASPGEHVLHVSVANCDVSMPVRVVAGMTTRVLFHPSLHCGTEMATLYASTSRTTVRGYESRHERLFIDGHELGLTPIDGIPITIGTHSIVLRDHAGRQTLSWSINCRAGGRCGVTGADFSLDPFSQ